MPTITLIHTGAKFTSNDQTELDTIQEIENKAAYAIAKRKADKSIPSFVVDSITRVDREKLENITKFRYVTFIEAVDDSFTVGANTLTEMHDELIDIIYYTYGNDDVFTVIPFENGNRINISLNMTTTV